MIDSKGPQIPLPRGATC